MTSIYARTRRAAAAAWAAWVFATGASHAAGVPADPGDYVALPPGTQIAIAHYQHLTADDVYANGHKVADSLGLAVDLAIVRYVRYFDLLGMPAETQVMLPFGQQRVDLSGQKLRGTGDAIFGLGIYPIHDLVNNQHLGFTLFVTPPTGSHRSDGYLLSPNRWTYNLQGGYIQSLVPGWSVDANVQTEFYGDDRDTGATKRPFLQVDGSLSYHPDDRTRLAATLRLARNGEDRLNGVKFGSEKRDIFVGTWSHFLEGKQWQWQLQYRHDFKVEDGAAVRGVQTRLLYLF